MSSLMFYCPRVSISTIFEKRLTHGRTDRRTDGRTDKASYRDAWTHLKNMKFSSNPDIFWVFFPKIKVFAVTELDIIFGKDQMICPLYK